MKTYQITLKYVAYAHYEIEANSPEEAEEQAWDEVRFGSERATSYGEWTADSIEEVTA